MGYVGHWLQEHGMDTSRLSLTREGAIEMLKGMWLGILLLLLGAVAFVSAVILAYPVMAHIAAKFFQ